MAASIVRKKQVPELKILQSLAFLAVVLQSALIYTINQPHLMPEQTIIIGMFFNFAKFSAPAFIFIVGFTLFHLHEKQVHYSHYVLEKAEELLLPYITWSAVYLIMAKELPFLFDGTLSQTMHALLTGSAAPHLWYVVMMFQIHLLFPFLFASFHWFRHRVQSAASLYVTVGAFALLYVLLLWLSSHYIFNGEQLTSSALLPYVDRTFLFYFFYFLLGGIAAATLPKWRRFVLRHVPFNTFLFLLLFLTVGYELLSFEGVREIDLSVSTYLKPSMFFYITSEILLLYALSITIVQSRTFLYRLLQFIGRFTYGAYLAHFFFLHLCVRLLAALAVPTHSILYALLLFISTTALSIGSIVLFTFLPFGRLLAGPAVKPEWKLPFFSQLTPNEMKK